MSEIRDLLDWSKKNHIIDDQDFRKCVNELKSLEKDRERLEHLLEYGARVERGLTVTEFNCRIDIDLDVENGF